MEGERVGRGREIDLIKLDLSEINTKETVRVGKDGTHDGNCTSGSGSPIWIFLVVGYLRS